ncbi:MAG TPA: hypothetical protein VGJ54_11210 [Streptosporangiaceae bacterium]
MRALQLAGQELQPDAGGAQLLGEGRELDAAAARSRPSLACAAAGPGR